MTPADDFDSTNSNQTTLAVSPDVIARLMNQQIEIGYRLATIYTACVTGYVAIAGVLAKMYFESLGSGTSAARLFSTVGLVLSTVTLTAPRGLRKTREAIESKVNYYAQLLKVPPEDFYVIRYGGLASLFLFWAIFATWLALFAVSLVGVGD